MPTYCYTCEKDHKWEETTASCADKPDDEFVVCPKCKSRAFRDYRAELICPPPPSCYSDEGYLWSDAAGVASCAIEKERKRFPHHVFRRTEEGTYQRGFKSAKHRRQCLRELGLVDKRSFY
jgi:hypothetical protein